MKVLQINAVYKTKSTGRIVMEMHKYFQNKGIESYVAYATENTDMSGDPHVFQVGTLLDHKIHAVQSRMDKLQGCHSTLETKRLLKKITEIRPDIVLTHNLHSNYINVPVLLKGLTDLNVKIVLDLHDCWFLTGGCYHYTANGCDKWLQGCNNCPKFGKVAKKKYDINCDMFDYSHPTIVATSKWIENEARKSLLASRTNITMIYDWIDSVTFHPMDDKDIRKKLGVGNKKIILGVATGWAPDKGQLEMIELAKAMPNAVIILVGHQPEHVVYPENVITIAFTDSKEELAEIYSAADVFFNPSKQETFGLVSGEALACGTPLVVYNTTACPEFVTEETGVVMEIGSDIVSAVKAMLDKNERFGREYVRVQCRQFVEKNFNMGNNIDAYIELFKHLACEDK